jgi:hypothetical protein
VLPPLAVVPPPPVLVDAGEQLAVVPESAAVTGSTKAVTTDPAKALSAAEQRLKSTPAGETDIVEPLQFAVGELRERSRGL